ncbi:MAG: phenylalanine--tRNA ligase beta subunit-related protein [Bacteroidota bacterium]|nr:phenylalanine--tRNA ligase beta subunit-related protein [Bacteroidota bacterium]MDP4204687.1 phenylalanine--tRNA ligase beta subunit-related protein [Bacteroidota bacterium]
MHLSIHDSIYEKWPDTTLGVITATVLCHPENPELKNELNELSAHYQSQLQIEDIAKLKSIADTRSAYKAFGKEPSRYRVSSEALLRRILQGKGLYYINTIVDTGNLVSIYSQFGVCCFDQEKIVGDIQFCIANEGETYQGIGKGILNISNLPVFKDSQGSFGSPTSDSDRTKITLDTQQLLFCIVSFSGRNNLEHLLQYALSRLEKYCNATDVSVQII